MANSFLKKERDNERRLQKLERRYDKTGEALRRFMADTREIGALITEKVIDHDHGQMLYDRARQKYEDHERLKRFRRDLDKVPGKVFQSYKWIGLFLAGVVIFWWQIFDAWLS